MQSDRYQGRITPLKLTILYQLAISMLGRVSGIIFLCSAIMNWPLRVNSFKERLDDFYWGSKTKLMLQKRIKMGTL